ncbi:MAG: hypothetical protein J0665_06195 [Deltaproteobacteria bacterium]|nr:hypothetical protein [Deltaproteobacteria bacterium]
MKKRFSTIFTITVAAVLISSVAYAAKKKLQTKSEPVTPDVSEVDLATELLDIKGFYKNKPLLTDASNLNKESDDRLIELTMAKQDVRKIRSKYTSR